MAMTNTRQAKCIKSILKTDEPRKCRKRNVQFSTKSTYLFDITYGGSAVPSKGPPIGMRRSHYEKDSTELSHVMDLPRRKVRVLPYEERVNMIRRISARREMSPIEMLLQAHLCESLIEVVSEDVRTIQEKRRETRIELKKRTANLNDEKNSKRRRLSM